MLRICMCMEQTRRNKTNRVGVNLVRSFTVKFTRSILLGGQSAHLVAGCTNVGPIESPIGDCTLNPVMESTFDGIKL